MAVEAKRKRKPAEYIEEVKDAILRRFPEAEFEVLRHDRNEYRIRVFGDFESMDEVFDLTSELTSEILGESGILISVLPLGPRRDN